MIKFNYVDTLGKVSTARSKAAFYLLSTVVEHKHVETVELWYKHVFVATIEEPDYRAIQAAINNGKLNHEDWSVVEEIRPEYDHEIGFNSDGTPTEEFQTDFLSFCDDMILKMEFKC